GAEGGSPSGAPAGRGLPGPGAPIRGCPRETGTGRIPESASAGGGVSRFRFSNEHTNESSDRTVRWGILATGVCMELKDTTVLLLGGAGLVGQAVARAI